MLKESLDEYNQILTPKLTSKNSLLSPKIVDPIITTQDIDNEDSA